MLPFCLFYLLSSAYHSANEFVDSTKPLPKAGVWGWVIHLFVCRICNLVIYYPQRTTRHTNVQSRADATNAA